LVSCAQILPASVRSTYRAVLVLHASELPQGRGWSPHVCAILGGANQITVSMVEAADRVDAGDIWLRTRFELEGHELLPEIHERLFEVETALMTQAVDHFGEIRPVPQRGEPGPALP